MLKIGIIGFGYVGKAMHKLFSNHYHIEIYDPLYDHSCTRDKINACDAAIICVPTPKSKTGECCTDIVEDVVSWLETPLILIKSTVKVGTTEKLKEEYLKRIVFSPEYCGESSYWTPYGFHSDIKETPFFTFGGDRKDTSEFVSIYMPVVGPTKTYRQTTSAEAEMAKYMENVFYAMKITFCYEMSEICKATNVDYNEVRELWLLDPRINPMHTAVFKDNDYPFSGKCLPKDTAALVELSKGADYDSRLIKEVLESNERIQRLRKQRR